MPEGAVLVGGFPEQGLRAYLAVRGGFDVEPTLGSRSTDTLGRIGPQLNVGELRLGPDPGGELPTDLVPAASCADEAGVEPGPRRDWFTADAWRTLVGSRWRLSSAVDRVGARLIGPALERCRHDELASEGLVPGAIQVPPDGQPIVMLADHPVTGGYPVIAVVDPADLWVVAQAAPGTTLRFRAGL
jgi:biotin-dependent carboxylase-like uncharacterized protein